MSNHNIDLTTRADDTKRELYKYTPNLGANLFMFLLLLFLQIIRQIFSYRKYSKHVDIISRSENQSNKSLVNLGNDEINSKGINAIQLKKVFEKYVCCFIPFLIENLCGAIGYIGRVGSHSDKEKISYYIIQSILTLISFAFKFVIAKT